MSLISTAYFKGSLFIPNIGTVLGNGESPVANKLNMLIEYEEPKLLVELFGYSMYQDLLNNMSSTCYQQLLCGADFIDSCKRNNHWGGLIDCDLQPCGYTGKSLIAKYIYTRWIDLHSTTSTGIGEVKPNTDNGENVQNWHKYVYVWNEMIGEIALMYEFIEANRACYPLWNNRTCKKFKRMNTFGL